MKYDNKIGKYREEVKVLVDLYDFLEVLEPESRIKLIAEDTCLYQGKVKEVPEEICSQYIPVARKVIWDEKEVNIFLKYQEHADWKREKKVYFLEKNCWMIVIAELKDDLTEVEKIFIYYRIDELKRIFAIKQDGNIFYSKKGGISSSVNFLFRLKRHKEYFKTLEYSDYACGREHDSVLDWDRN